MSVKGIDIPKAVDAMLAKMEAGKVFSWAGWWKSCIGRQAPKQNTKAHFFFIRERLRVKNNINSEFEKRNLPHRLICQNGKGVYLLDEKEISEKAIRTRMKKTVACLGRSKKVLSVLATASKLDPNDASMLMRHASAIDMTESGLVGLIARMRIPKEMKKQLLLEMGAEV